MSASYAGIRLAVLPDDYSEWLTQFHPLPLEDGRVIGDIVGTLVWPTGLSRYASGSFLIDGLGLAAIRTALGVTAGPGALVLGDGTHTRTFPLYTLPARPLAQIAGQGQAYLLELVDSRYFLQSIAVSITSVPVSWTALFATLATALGITLSVGIIDADYGVPTDLWLVNEQPAALLLDLAATRIGHVVVANLNGTFSTLPFVTAAAGELAQTSSFSKTAGGLVVSSDLIRSVPASVKVVFRSTSSVPLTLTNTLFSLGVSGYGTATGVAGAQTTLFGELVYDGTNGTACANYAAQASYDWYLWQLCDLDVTLPGIAQWTPTGCEDRIEWKYEVDRILTRITRGPFFVTAGLPATLIGQVDPPVLAKITAVSGATPPVHTARRQTRKTSATVNTVVDYSPVTDYYQVLNPNAVAIPVNTLVELFPIIDKPGWYWAHPIYTPGCGLGLNSTNPNILKLHLTDVVQDGLYWNDSICTVGVNFGCGLTLVGDELQADMAQLAGTRAVTSLVVYPQLGCDNLAVDLNDDHTTTETLVNAVSLTLVGSVLTFSKTLTTYTNHFNAASLLIGRSAGSPSTSTYHFDVCGVNCCSDCVTPGSQEYTSPGLHTFTATCSGLHTITCWAGGGGGATGFFDGGSGMNIGGGGGGGGAWSKVVVCLVSGTSYNLDVGAGGAIGAVGLDSDFKIGATTVLLALGGGGASGLTHGTGGQAASGIGDFRYSGGNGADGAAVLNGGGGGGGAGDSPDGGTTPGDGGNATGSTGGTGTAPSGGNGGTGGVTAAQNGTAGSALGGGGGGGQSAGGLGGAGASGKVVIVW